LIIAVALMFTTSCQKKDTTNPGTANQIGTGNTKSSNWNSYVFQPGANMYGHSYSAWSATWWKWLMEFPVAGNPSIDDPGFNVISGQSGNVWFLAAPFGTVTRTCNIPSGKALYVGLLNAEASSLEGFGTAALQLGNATYNADHIINLFATIDGVTTGNLTSYRFASPQFTFTAPTPWIFGSTGGSGTSVGDGYYLMFKPLETGSHTLHYGGEFLFTLANDGFDWVGPIDMTYNLTVMP
jgi:hypothetical protein